MTYTFNKYIILVHRGKYKSYRNICHICHMPQKRSVKCRLSVERVSRDPRETVEKGTATRSAAAQQSATKGAPRPPEGGGRMENGEDPNPDPSRSARAPQKLIPIVGANLAQ